MAENKSFLESISEVKRPESFEQEAFVKVNNKNTMKLLIGIISLAMATVLIFILYSQSQKVEMKEFVGENITDVSVWAQKNGLILVAKSIYSFEEAEGIVLEQEVSAGQTLKKKDTFTLIVSAGADPEEAITFPDLMSMNAEVIDEWIDQNKLTGIQISTASSTLIGKDEVISYSFTDGDEDSFLRKNRVAITLSSGPAEEGDTVIVTDFSLLNVGKILQWGIANDIPITIEEAYNKYFAKGDIVSQSIGSGEEILKNQPITVIVSLGEAEKVPDFSGMNAGKVLQWGSDNGIRIQITEAFSKYFTLGAVISQSVKMGSEIVEDQAITVQISLGEPVIVSDFSAQTKEEASAWAKQSGATITLVESYHSSIPKGQLIQQNLSKGTQIQAGDEIKLYFSLGRVDVANYIGKTKLDLLAWQTEVNSKGATITLKFKESTGAKGTFGKVIAQSSIDNQANTDAVIEVTVSKGAVVMVPDFGDLSETECAALANDLGLNVQYQYAASASVHQGYLIRQEPGKGALIGDSATVMLTISLSELKLKTVVVPDFSSMKASEILLWGSDNDVKVQLYETYNSFISSGSVVSQSVAKTTVVEKGSSILFYISMGKAPQVADVDSAKVPNFSLLSETEANAWAKNANITLSMLSKYSDSRPKGTLYDQSIAVDSWISATEMMKVTLSLGKVSIANFVGKTKLDVLTWQQEMNAKGANITVNFNVVAGATGLVTSQSIKNDFITLNETIDFDLAE